MQQYTGNLYRRDPNINDIFNDNLYEDEPYKVYILYIYIYIIYICIYVHMYITYMY